MTLSPLAYHYQHRAEIESVVQGTDRDARFDALCASSGTAIASDRTLGGLCDRIEPEAPSFSRPAHRGRGQHEGRGDPGRSALFHV